LTGLVTARAIAVRRGQARLIDPINLEIAGGEFVLLIGPNGAGKSTLMRALSGLERLSQGEVVRQRRTRIGYVPQHLGRDETLPLTAADFLDLARQRTRDAEIMSTLGIEPLADRPLAALSGGELRRVALARALLRRPNLYLLDEPLAGIDLASQEPILALLAERVAASGAGLLLVAHEILSALPFASRLVLLERTIVDDGEPGEVARSPEFERLFGPLITEAATRILAGQHPLGAHG
jgi:zinc transport system ATP-binding protein